MTDPIKNGGPAFPGTEANGLNSGCYGMTLRDYFAAKAMQGMLAETLYGLDWQKNVASAAYELADAMLEAREVAA